MKILFTANYRGKVYKVKECSFDDDGNIYVTKFFNEDFSPDSEHVKNIQIQKIEVKSELSAAGIIWSASN